VTAAEGGGYAVPLAFMLRRIVAVVPTFFLVTVLIFVMVRLLPGDPATLILGEAASAESVAALRQRLGLDQPLVVQYLRWFGLALRGDFGVSNSGVPIATLIGQKLPITLQLTAYAILISIAVAFVAGIVSSVFPEKLIDRFITVVSIVGICLPTFFTGILLIYGFSIHLRWLPSSGYVAFGDDPLRSIRHMILPSVTLGFYSAAVLTRYLRTSMLEVFDLDFVRTGRSKGVGGLRLVFRHVLRNAIIPVVTVLGLQLGVLIGGAIITEQVFGVPGIGNMLVVSVLNRDLGTIQAIALVTAIAVFAINFVVDVAYAYIDPRIRY
jgi:peptide/nickel transport system permease protein